MLSAHALSVGDPATPFRERALASCRVGTRAILLKNISNAVPASEEENEFKINRTFLEISVDVRYFFTRAGDSVNVQRFLFCFFKCPVSYR